MDGSLLFLHRRFFEGTIFLLILTTGHISLLHIPRLFFFDLFILLSLQLLFVFRLFSVINLFYPSHSFLIHSLYLRFLPPFSPFLPIILTDPLISTLLFSCSLSYSLYLYPSYSCLYSFSSFFSFSSHPPSILHILPLPSFILIYSPIPVNILTTFSFSHSYSYRSS